jgi:ribose 5-phosphate isomerase B
MSVKKKIFIGSDHRGFNLKSRIIKFLEAKGYKVLDKGVYSTVSCDYPKIAFEVARLVSRHRNSVGILVCKTGIGNSIVANKVSGVRAALCYNKKTARLSREHNNANVLVLGADFIRIKNLKQLITIWLNTDFRGGRHRRRVNQISKIERKVFKKS